METIMQYIPLAVSAILLAALILTVITNIITQVLKFLSTPSARRATPWPLVQKPFP